jgi:RHS repeat-associated protein
MLKLLLKIIKKKLKKSNILKLLYFTFLFIFNSINLFANDLPPSTIVDDLVNVTTGNLYLNKTDSIALGKEPFLFTRKYLNITNLNEVSDGDLIYPNELESEEFKLSGWSFLKHTKACIKSDKGGRRLDIYDSNGSTLRFDFIKLDKKQKNISKILKLRNVFMGFSQVGNAITEFSSNYRNVKVISENDKDITVYLSNGVIRKYHRLEGGDENFDLKEEILKNGNKIVYEHNNHSYLTKISTISPKNKVLSFITIDHKHADWKRKNKNNEKADKYDFSINTNNGQTIHYMFDNYQILLNHKGKRYDEKLFYLKEVKTPTHTENIKYHLDYKMTNPLLYEYHLPGGRFFKVNYYLQGNKNPDVGISIKDLNDDRFQKVSSIESFDSIDKPKYRFFYEFATPYKKGGKTTVLDYYDNKTIYHYSDKLRVQKIEKYEQNNLHNFLTYLWGKDNTNEEGFYKGSVFHNNKGLAIHAFVNIYDNANKGNIVKKVIYGNLTGNNNNFVALDRNDYPSENNNESYSKTFEYNCDNLIIKEIDEDGVSIEYTYLPKTNLISKKFIKYLDQIKQRFFYSYDEENFLIEEIEDDGISINKNDLSDVTKRLIKKTIPSKNLNLYGFTNSIEEKYLNLNTLKEKLLKKENIFYFPNGKIKQKDIYDANNTLRYSLYYSYDSRGNLESETDPLGRKATYKYDANSNKIYEKDFSEKVAFFEYDQNNRLIKKTLKVNSLDYSTKYQYDVNNNLIAEIDPRDNITEFKYDAFGNVIEKILPPVLDENKNHIQKVFKYEYDEKGRCIKEIFPNNDITLKKYNYYGNITYIKHPDNTEERFIYNKNGSLKKHINQIGTVTEYEYDYQKRVTSKKIISSKEEKLFEENFEYSAYDLISHIDNAKNKANYSYDYSGKKIKEEKISSDQKLIFKEEYFYNELRLLDKIVQGNLLIIKYEKDLQGKVLEENRLNLENQVLYKIGYEYDKSDNLSCIKTFLNNKEQKKYLFYDELNRLIKIIDPLNNIEITQYNDFYLNELNQKVKQKIVTNAIGQRTVIIYDSIGREEKVEEINSKEINENILSLEEKFYDLNDNLRFQKSTIYNPDRSFKKIITSWDYDNMNRLIKLTEAKNSKDEKETSYTYSPTGLLLKTIKTDGVVLVNNYDELNNNIEIKSSDESIHYKFSYNNLNQCILAIDLINDETIKRKYDSSGNLIEEKLTNNLVISHDYDLLGNRIKTIYPDSSYAIYKYDPINLKKIIRTDKNGKSYEHCFDKYDLDGNLLEETLINKNKINNQIDDLGRIASINAKGFKQNIKSYDKIGKIEGIITKTSSYQNDCDFSYDELNQLTNETELFENSYTYDSHYNRLSKNEDNYSVNDLNELLNTTLDQFEYDKNGRPYIKRSETKNTLFFYDALDRLIKVEVANDVIIYFSYDAFHRRTKKIKNKHIQGYFTDSWEITNESYIYDDQNEIGSIDENNNIKTLRILSESENAEIGSCISFEILGKIYIPIYDFQGNVVCLQDLNQNEVESYSYSAFGEKKIYDSWNYEISSSYINNPWQYLSKRIDEETNLVFFGRRYYDPEIGRWLTPDPLGFVNGQNLYAYVLNDPLIKLDLYGLEINDFPRMEFPKNNLNFLLNINLNFHSYWKYLMFMKVQNLTFFSNQKTNFFNNNFSFVNSFCGITGPFSFDFFKGVFEVFTGIDLAYPSTKIGTSGRIFGRYTAKLYADVSIVLGLVMTTSGTFTSGATPVLALAGGPIGIATAAASPALIAGGALATAQGLVLHRNYDKLSTLKVSKNNIVIDEKFYNQLNKQLEKDGSKSIIKSHNSLNKSLQEHIKKLPSLKFKSSVEREIKTFQKQKLTIEIFAKKNNIQLP